MYISIYKKFSFTFHLLKTEVPWLLLYVLSIQQNFHIHRTQSRTLSGKKKDLPLYSSSSNTNHRHDICMLSYGKDSLLSWYIIRLYKIYYLWYIHFFLFIKSILSHIFPLESKNVKIKNYKLICQILKMLSSVHQGRTWLCRFHPHVHSAALWEPPG